MHVTEVYGCGFARGLFVARPSDVLFKPTPPVSAFPELRLPALSSGSPTSFTSKGFFHRIASNPDPFLCLYGTGRAQRRSPWRLAKDVTSRRRRLLIRSEAAAGNGAGRVDADSTSNCLYLKRTVLGGEVVEHSGTVVVLGDVEPGGHVLADGDVIVLGRLRGHVHAGRSRGAVTPRIFATIMEPEGLRICDIAVAGVDSDRSGRPKMAGLSTDGRVRIFPATDEPVEKQSAPLEGAGIARRVQMQQAEGSRNQGPARVALGTGIYISAAGIALLGFPKALFGILFDLQGVALGWVRVGAILAVVFGVYYIGTAVGDMRGLNGAEAFYLATVVGRTFLFLSFSWLVLTGAVPGPLLLVGAVNLVGAMVMLKALLVSPAQKSSG